MESYKETISQQTNEINQLKQHVFELDNSKSSLQKQVEELEERLKAMVKLWGFCEEKESFSIYIISKRKKFH